VNSQNEQERAALAEDSTADGNSGPAIDVALHAVFAMDGCRVLRRKAERDGDYVPSIEFGAAK